MFGQNLKRLNRIDSSIFSVFRLASKVATDPAPINPSLATPTNVQEEGEKSTLQPIKSSHILNVTQSRNSLIEEEIMAKSLPFDEVPGPTFLKKMAKIWSYIPILSGHVTANSIQYLLSAGTNLKKYSLYYSSQLSWGNNSWFFNYLLDEYGPIVRLYGPFGGDVVIISRPEHANAVFINEGRYPVRFSLDCLEKYRMEHRRYKQTGPFLMFGPEWEQLRKTIEVPLQQCLSNQYPMIEDTCNKFMNRLTQLRNRQEEVPSNFLDEIHKWNVECLFNVMVDKDIDFLNSNGMQTEQQKLLEALNGATKAIKKCEYGLHLWKFIETPAWRSLTKNCDVIDSILGKYVHRTQTTLQLKRNEQNLKHEKISLMEHLLLKENMLSEDIHTVFLDMLLIGMNTISHTIAFLLYHLSRYPRTQRLLYLEVRDLKTIDKETLMALPYLQACVKESLRLKPPMPILNRVLSKDVAINNFRIPKGTYVLIATYLSSLREEHFEDALRFKPERWLKEDSVDMPQMASVPYGYGPKACLGRDLAELQVGMLLCKIIRKFRVEYHYGDINSDNRLLSAPDRPLKFKFLER